jgi:hypothetical protein
VGGRAGEASHQRRTWKVHTYVNQMQIMYKATATVTSCRQHVLTTLRLGPCLQASEPCFLTGSDVHDMVSSVIGSVHGHESEHATLRPYGALDTESKRNAAAMARQASFSPRPGQAFVSQGALSTCCHGHRLGLVHCASSWCHSYLAFRIVIVARSIPTRIAV